MNSFVLEKGVQTVIYKDFDPSKSLNTCPQPSPSFPKHSRRGINQAVAFLTPSRILINEVVNIHRTDDSRGGKKK